MSRKPSPSTLIAIAALFFSLTGAGIAASRYVITSASQIKPRVLRQLQGMRDTGTTRGPQGIQGVQGIPGRDGAPGAAPDVAHHIIFVTGNTVTFGPSGISDGQDETPARVGSDALGAGTATCPTGYYLLSGGFRGQHVTVTSSFPQDAHGDPPTTWIADGHLDANEAGKEPALGDGRLGYFIVFAECAPI